MKDIFRPTLVRRVFSSLLIGFPIVFLVLIARAYSNIPSVEDNIAVKKIALVAWRASLLDTFSQVRTDAEAVIFIRAIEVDANLQNRINHLPLVKMQLWNRDHTLLFSNTNGNEALLLGDFIQVKNVGVGDGNYLVFGGRGSQGEFMIAYPVYGGVVPLNFGTWAFLLIDVTLAFLCMAPLLWIAVVQGLRPLRQLSSAIETRSTEDFSLINTDVTYGELKPLVFSLNSLLQRLRKKIKREHTFVQDAAHELRTPMAVISAQAHVLAKASGIVQREEAEKKLDHAIARASHLIQQLLLLALVDTERSRDVAVVDVAQVVRQELAQLVPTAIASHVELSLISPDTLIHAIELQSFLSIFHNLLDNAIRYSHAEGQVVVELKNVEGVFVLSVADNGIGLTDGEKERIFERFYRGDRHDKSGSGLGLAIVKQMVEKMNGKIEVMQGIDCVGCQFVVEIPAQR